MSLYQSLSDAQLDARKKRDAERLNILQIALSAVKNERINAQKELSDEETQQVLARLVKQMRDALKDFIAGGRVDLVEKSEKEIQLIESFLPAQLSDVEIESAVVSVINEIHPSGLGDIGAVMGKVMALLKGRVDGNRVRDIASKKLNAV